MIWTDWLGVVRRTVGAVRTTRDGIGVVAPSTMRGTFTEPFVGIVNAADSPDRVMPFSTQVARAFTDPKFAGMFGSTHVPSGFTCTVRLSTLTTQWSLSWAAASIDVDDEGGLVGIW